MKHLKEQLHHLNELCGFIDDADNARAGGSALNWSEEDLLTKTDAPALLFPQDRMAQSIGWVRWFVTQACGTAHAVETTSNGECVLRGSQKIHVLPAGRDSSPREAAEGLVMALIEETMTTMNQRFRTALAALPQGTEMSCSLADMGKGISGGNCEGMQYAAEALCTLFESRPAAGDDELRLRAMQLGSGVRDGMRCHLKLQKIIDALVYAQCRPFDVLAQADGRPALALRPEVMEYTEDVAPLLREPRGATEYFHASVIEGLYTFSLRREPPDMDTPHRLRKMINPQMDDNASEEARERVETQRFSGTLEQRLAYVGAVTLHQLQRNARGHERILYGCPLGHAGIFGRWYRYLAEPMTEWWLGRRRAGCA